MKHPGTPLLGVSRETSDRLAAFAELVLQWNKTVNLVSRRDEEFLWSRHIEDSLGLIPALPTASGDAIDLGSGAGFPGMVLAIATGRLFHLVESDQRKASFLREAARVTGAPVRVHTVRAEAVDLPLASLVTARALARLDTLLTYAIRLLAPGGVCLFPKGRSVEDELTEASARWQMRVERLPSSTDPQASILRIGEISRVRPGS